LADVFVGRLFGSLLRDHTNLVDVAAELDHTPAGTAKARLLSKLPGNQVFKVDFAERTLRLPRLHPAWHDMTILHLSDLHFCGSPNRSFYRYVLDRCAAWDPDILAVTGDYVDSDEHRRWIVPMLSRLRWREAAFAIMGNHDQWYEPPKIRRRLKRLGMYVLGNSWTEITLRGQPMVVIGNEGPWYKPPTGSIGAPRERFRLCLSHTPDNMPWARREGIDLMLCGHVHGGQIRVPVIGSIIVPSRYGRRYDCGTFTEGPTVMHVSRGLGAEQPLRFNCAPEVTLITLQREAY
jgi:predicted MPP superfamily phosphohydrolase